jgi:hypothetical protein
MPPNAALMMLPLAWWWDIATNGNILTVASETLQLNGYLMNMTLRLELLDIKDVAFVSRYGNST